MNRDIAWDDLRLILAIAVAGTLSGAARKLGVSHATVFRRLGDIEQRLGVTLFERGRTGYSPTVAGEDMAAAARRIEAEVLEVERRVVGRDLRPSGTVRVTTTDTLLAGLLSPVFVAFRKAYPDIALEVAISNQLFSLSKREADVAIRPSVAPPEALVGRRVSTIAQAIYGHRDALPSEEAETPDIRTLDWVGPDEAMVYRPLEKWMSAQGLDAVTHYRVDTLLGILAAVKDGAGVAVLPCYLAQGHAEMTRLGPPVSELATDLWLLTHPDLQKTARIRAFLDFTNAAVKVRRARLEGQAS